MFTAAVHFKKQPRKSSVPVKSMPLFSSKSFKLTIQLSIASSSANQKLNLRLVLYIVKEQHSLTMAYVHKWTSIY